VKLSVREVELAYGSMQPPDVVPGSGLCSYAVVGLEFEN
jgi:hypothetical protein